MLSIWLSAQNYVVQTHENYVGIRIDGFVNPAYMLGFDRRILSEFSRARSDRDARASDSDRRSTDD